MVLEEILKITKQIASEIVSIEAIELEQNAKWPEKSLRTLQSEGLGGLVIPENLGGLGQGLVGLVKVCEILGEYNPSTALCFGMHCVGSAVISSKATEIQKKEYLEPIIQGKHLTTLALSEPGTGVHFYYPQTQLFSHDNKNLRINGEKTFITNGGHADSYVVSTLAVEPDAPPFQFSCVIIDKKTGGLEWGPEWNGMGMKGNSSRSLKMKDVLIPDSKLLGQKGDQIWYVFNVIAPYFLMAMAGTYLGLAQAAFDEAKNHLLKRNYSHSGTSLGQNSFLQYKLGVLWAQIERTRRLVYFAAMEGEKRDSNSFHAVLSAKAEVAECVVKVINEVITFMGGLGYKENSKLKSFLLDAQAAHIMAPTTNQLYTWLGRSILDQPLLSD